MLYLKAVITDAADNEHTLGDELLKCKLAFMEKAASHF